MPRNLNFVDWLAFTILIVGGLIWGLVGLFEYNLVASIFGGEKEVLSKIVYSIFGFAALYVAYSLTKITSIFSEKADVTTIKKNELKKAG